MAEPQKPQELLIIKRYRGGAHDHHGGAWKIAFADFMTAMMALFLVLWLINATSQKTKASLARYFNPVNLVDMSTLKRGVHDPNDAAAADATAGEAAPTQSGAAPESKQDDVPPADAKSNDEGTIGVARPPTHSEAALFRDPYAVLAEIAASSQTGTPSSNGSDLSSGDRGNGGDATEAYRDPFKIVTPSAPPRMPSNVPANAAPNSAAPAANTPTDAPAAKANQAPAPAPPTAMQGAAPSQPAAGAPDIKVNQVPGADSITAQKDMPKGGTEAGKLQSEIANIVGSNGKGDAAPHIEVTTTDEGVLIRLTDETNYAMFAIGSAEPQPKTVQVMAKIAQLLKAEKGTIILRGHTDGRPYKSATYDNWRLSTARAQMAYYMLVRGGLDEKRIERIEGYADREPKVPNNPLADENRRIEILLRKEKP